VGAVENETVQCTNSMSAENEQYIVANCKMEYKNACFWPSVEKRLEFKHFCEFESVLKTALDLGSGDQMDWFAETSLDQKISCKSTVQVYIEEVFKEEA
jgi:hypothetical protein